MLKDPNTRPKLYFNPQEVVDQSLMEPTMFSLYLHQNMPQFYADIGDLADCLENYSHQDDVISSTEYSYSNMQEIYDAQRLSGLICASSVSETNIHCADANRQVGGSISAFTSMQKPYYFEHKTQLKVNKLSLRDTLKESQLVKGELFSEDLLIRSMRDSQLNIVPYLQ